MKVLSLLNSEMLICVSFVFRLLGNTDVFSCLCTVCVPLLIKVLSLLNSEMLICVPFVFRLCSVTYESIVFVVF